MIPKDIPPIVRKILTSRGLKDEKEMRSFLFSGISNLLDPFNIPKLKKACETLKESVVKKEKIFIYGDGDVDGISGVFLLLSFLKGQGVTPSFYLTHRLEKNYEIDASLIKELKEKDYSLFITIDCGISSIEALKKAEEEGIKCIVMDHHISDNPENLPISHIYLSPHKYKWNKDLNYLSGTGIVYKFISGMEQVLPNFKEKKVSEMVEIPCLAALADFVPLVGENRILVKEGLKQLPFTSVKGLTSLLSYYKLSSYISKKDILMRVNPKLNSPGRLGKPEVVLELLLATDTLLIDELVAEIDKLDKERYREVTKIMKKVELPENIKTGFILLKDNLKGFGGIIASRFSGKYNRPFIVCYELDNWIRGSIRAPEGCSLQSFKSDIKQYVDELGGHTQAAGFKCSSKEIKKIKNIWNTTKWKIKKRRDYDSLLDIENLTPSLIKDIFEYLEPFGQGNPIPVFLSKDISIKRIRSVSKNNRKCWTKKNSSLFESYILDGVDIPNNTENTDIYYTPYLRESNGMYRIFLEIIGFKD